MVGTRDVYAVTNPTLDSLLADRRGAPRGDGGRAKGAAHRGGSNPGVVTAKPERAELGRAERAPALRHAGELTSERLHYQFAPCDTDPNRLVASRASNCVGYAALYATACVDLLGAAGVAEEWAVEHAVARLHLFGYDVHNLFDDPFFRDHDVVVLRHPRTGEVVAVDPTLLDYAGIERVALR